MSRMFDELKRAEAERRGESRVLDETMPSRLQKGEAGPVDVSQLPEAFIRELGALRNSLEGLFGSQEKRSLLFAGATAGEGTTTIATSFARFLAMQGTERVLVCEMNARQPAFSTLFSINGAGVTDYFTKQHRLESIVQTPEGIDLDVLHVGGRDPSLIQIRLAQFMPRLIEEAFEHYDTVIIDAPPVVSCPETPAMSAFVDGMVLVVHAGKTKREVAIRALEAVKNYEGKVVGVVLNRKKYYIPGFLYRRI